MAISQYCINMERVRSTHTILIHKIDISVKKIRHDAWSQFEY
jgi:hypothetical protein